MASDKLRDHLTQLDATLGQRANMLWSLALPIHARQSRPDSNENGAAHCQMVETNAWRFLKESNVADASSPLDLFLLSCSACCHDFDKGLLSAIPTKLDHGEGSGRFVIDQSLNLILTQPEAIAIGMIAGLHDKKGKQFRLGLLALPDKFPLGTGVVDVRRLALVIKAADTLHTDNSRISDLAVDCSRLTGFDKQKHLARQCITGWYVDGTRLIITAYPQSAEQMDALQQCCGYMKKTEWPAIGKSLRAYNMPYKLRFQIEGGLLREVAMAATSKQPPASPSAIGEVFHFYNAWVKPLYFASVAENKLPVEVLSEVTSAWDHLARHWTSGEAEPSVARKVFAHLRRACFDMFKLQVVEAVDKYHQLSKLDISDIDKGEFAKRLQVLVERIRERATAARHLEGATMSDDNATKQAFDLWSSVYADCVTLDKEFYHHPEVPWGKKRRRGFRLW